MEEGYANSVTRQVHQNDISGNYNAYIGDLSYNTKTNIDTSGNKTANSQSIDVSSLFNKSNTILIIWFLAIYLITYFALGYYFNKGTTAVAFQTALGRMLDFILIGVSIIFIFSLYYSTTEADRENLITDLTTKTKKNINDPFSVLFTGIFIFLLYIVIYLFRVPMTAESKPITISIIETISWLFFVFLIFVNFFKYFLGVSIADILDRVFGTKKVVQDKPTKDTSGNNIKPKDTNEVFNISNNLYTYDDAQAVCKAYGADIASYEQIENAYNDGADWCNYGWSDGQMIYFPTQKATWQKLQKDEKRKNNCGRPGINGGYMANPYLKFGVNCFGKKPTASADDLARMKTSSLTPKTPEDIELEKKVNYWKQHADKMLQISSFNKNKWSEY